MPRRSIRSACMSSRDPAAGRCFRQELADSLHRLCPAGLRQRCVPALHHHPESDPRQPMDFLPEAKRQGRERRTCGAPPKSAVASCLTSQ
jgi:hypothetical protein